jgi:cell division protein FtsB
MRGQKSVMRFSIRDLLWLTATTALAMVIYTDHVHTQRLVASWNQSTELEAQRIEAQRSTIHELKIENEILQHQMSTLEERARQSHVSIPAQKNP